MIRTATIALAFLSALPLTARAAGRGELELTAIAYPQAALFEAQSDARAQAVLSTSWSGSYRVGTQWDGDFSVFGRANPEADTPVTADIREATVSYYGTALNTSIGILNEHWGVLEANNLVDIVNQRDLVEDVGGDAKLGQPGASVTWQGATKQVQIYLLPYLRERRLAEDEDRFWTAELPYADAQYERGRGVPAVAARATAYAKNVEVSVSHYWGYSREPRLAAELEAGVRPVRLVPNYDLIHQTGLELQLIKGDTIWKTEAFYRQGDNGDNFSIGAGLERKFEALLGTRVAVTPYFEVYYDNRNEDAPRTAFDHDVFVGARMAFNDIADTEVNLNILADWENDSALVELEAGRRLADDWNVAIEALAPINVDDDRTLATLRNDARLRLHITRYF